MDMLPVRQHPTLTLLIDDSQSFLDSLSFQMHPDLAHKTFDDTRKALAWLNQNRPALRTPDEQPTPYYSVMNRQRFLTPSVLVVDYTMPHMDGLAFCQAVHHLSCKKILLTGLASEKIGDAALQSELIDGIVKKHDPDAMHRLESEIFRLQKAFFIGHSGSPLQPSYLSDPAFAALVAQLYGAHRFVEHDVFANPSGILFLDAQGKGTLMVVETRSSLISQSVRVKNQNGPDELFAALQACRLVAFFSDSDGKYSATISRDWPAYCLPAQVCHGKEDFYWALFDFPSHYLPAPVYSYADFLCDLDKGATDVNPGP
jgi:CheY-like chemotaxis protein